MRTRILIIVTSLFALGLFSAATLAFKTGEANANIGEIATSLVNQMDSAQKKIAILSADSPQQVAWHFIPKDARKGLELNNMSAAQREKTDQLLRGLLSATGHDKTKRIMGLEKLLKELQDKRGGNGPIRDHLRYYLTFFGTPAADSQWGLSFEGHHLSLNYVLKGDQVISSSPQFFATNPAVVKSENSVDVPLGTRVLRFEETLAFELVNSLSANQLNIAKLADKAPREIRAAGEAQPPQEAAAGITWKELSTEQRKLLRRLVAEYVNAVPKHVAAERMQAVKEAGYRKIHFAWAGAMNPGVGHYYRIQGPSFLIEFVNTQPDAAGNPANHIHCVWRDMRGDFAKPLGG